MKYYTAVAVVKYLCNDVSNNRGGPRNCFGCTIVRQLV